MRNARTNISLLDINIDIELAQGILDNMRDAIRVARTGVTGSILVNLSGRGDKDMDYIIEKYGLR